jgi:hypothetical protein
MNRKRLPEYLRRAKKRFLEGLWYSAPVDAVLAGKRTLEQWTDIVSEERELEMRGKTRGQRYVEKARDCKAEQLEL